MKLHVHLKPRHRGRQRPVGSTMTIRADEWSRWWRHWTTNCDLQAIQVWAGRGMPLASYRYLPGHGWRQVLVGRHPLPLPTKGSNARPLRRLPAGGVTVPVKGLSFRGDLWPENVYRLREILNIAGSLTEEQWQVRRFKRSAWRDALEVTLEWGRLPVDLVPEPSNQHDPYAVAVVCPYLGDYGFLGYLPATTHGRPNRVVAEGIANGEHWWGYIAKLRFHPDHPDNPGVDVHVQRAEAARSIA